MIRHCATILLVLMAAAMLPVLSASTLMTFDDPSFSNHSHIWNYYGGLSWSNFAVATGAQFDNAGQNGAQFTGNVAYNYANPATFSSTLPFVLETVYLGATVKDNITIDVSGYVDGELTPKYSKSILVDWSGPREFNFEQLDWGPVNSVSFTTTADPKGHHGSTKLYNFAMDDLTIDFQNVTDAPEPATLALIGLGLAVLGLVGKRVRA